MPNFRRRERQIEENIKNTVKLDVIYEDQNVIFINKPSGMLSQKAKETEVISGRECDSISFGIRTADKGESSDLSARPSATVWTGIPAV